MASPSGVLEVVAVEGGETKRYEWKGDAADREAARAAFEEVVARGGYLAMVVDSPRKMTQVRTFDEIEEIERERGAVTAQVSRQVVGG